MRKPVQQRGEETRGKILAAAKEIFSEKGYHNTNTKEIARHAGVATGSVYMYFPDKKEIFMEVFRSIYREIRENVIDENLQALFAADNPEDVVTLMIDTLSRAHKISPLFHKEVIVMVYTDPDIRRINDEEESQILNLVTGLLLKHKNKLRVQHLDAAVRVIHKAAEETIHSINIFGSDIEEGKILSELKDMISTYLIKPEYLKKRD